MIEKLWKKTVMQNDGKIVQMLKTCKTSKKKTQHRQKW